ncbi:hypothetical protein CBS101457_005953 [Exobasidium rhododendri]|nr:hypothetical protein CBS101457_005953 [Exobasidium rhododendri]
MSDSTNNQQSYLETAKSAAGVLGGHAQLANGAAQEQIGNLINSEDWKKSGIDTKGAAGENIKSAFEDFKAQGGEDSQVVNKASSMADAACPQTGSGVGDTPNSS